VVALNILNPKNKWKITQFRVGHEGGIFRIEEGNLRDITFNSLQDCISTLKQKNIVGGMTTTLPSICLTAIDPCSGSPFIKLSNDKDASVEDTMDSSNAYSYTAFQKEATKRDGLATTL
jgi:hypothetical protein